MNEQRDPMDATAGKGSVSSIHVARVGSAPMESRDSVRAIARRGLEGDRYCEDTGYYSGDPVWDASLTLIELEAIEGLKRNLGLEIEPGSARRNIVVRGIRLQELIGKKFRIGEVLLEGLKPWPPCSHLAQLVGNRNILQGLAHCGGIGAEILSDGHIRVGDSVELVA